MLKKDDGEFHKNCVALFKKMRAQYTVCYMCID